MCLSGAVRGTYKMKQKLKNLFNAPGVKYLIPALLTVLIYYFSNNTAGIVVFNAGNIAITLGVFFFGLSFFLKDFIQKKFGTKFTIWNTILAAVVVGILFAQSTVVRGDGDYTYFMILVVSVCTAVVSETIDSLVFRRIFKKDTRKAVRGSLISNLVSVPIDSAIFGFFALYLVLGLPAPLVIAISATEMVIKYILSGVLSPALSKIKAGRIWKEEKA